MTQSTAWRPQPPSITDPEAGDADLLYMGEEGNKPSLEEDDDQPKIDWKKRAKDAFRFSTSYVDSNYRSQWDDSIKAFNNQHPSNSKYNSEAFRKRSNLFRPKTRAIIRKNEAAAAAAFFSNQDLISVSAPNESIKEERVSAEVMQQVLQHRLSKTIPWFQVVCGGLQDGQVQGAVCAHVHWRFVERHDKQGNAEALEDKPIIDLIPIENLRIDPSSDWMNPVEASPYLIHLIPMYWCDVKDRMEHPDPKGRRWKKVSAQLAFAKDGYSDDSTRSTRAGVSQEPSQQKREISDYDIVWVHRHIHRYNGEDWEFYTINSEVMLTDPEKLIKTVWHGNRPYVIGRVILETHKALATPLPILVKPLQEEANDIQNQRSDNVKFVLNKRWFAKRGKNVDLPSLIRNTPGGITLMDDVETDVKEVNWPDVTQSSYLEQDRVDGDFSDLVGNFNPMQVQAQRTGRESTNTMRMLQGPSNLMTEYMLKTYVETFIQPVLRHLVMLEQHYETDLTILALAGEKAQVFQKYGVNEVTDAILDHDLSIVVNVGMGATDPVQKMQRFQAAIMSYHNITAKMPPPGMNLKEVWKELAGLAGYQDGTRFFMDGQDPALAKAQQQIQMLQRQLMQLQLEKKNKDGANVVKLHTSRESNATKVLIERMKQGDKASDRDHSNRQLLAQHIMSLGESSQAADQQGALQEQQFEQQQQIAKKEGAA